MKKIFSEYGGVVVTVIAVVALLGLVVFLMSDTGVMSNAFSKITGQMVDKSEQLINDVGSIKGEGSGSGGSGNQGGNQGGTAPLPDSGVNTETREITDSWEQIQQAIEEGVYAARYQLGDTKSFELTDGTEVVMQIVAFDEDDKADGSGKAAISWISKNIIAERTMNSTASNANGWAASKMRTWLQGEFFNAMPIDVRTVVIPVNKTYYDFTTKTTKLCSDTVWIPSAGEIFGNSYDSYGCEDSGAEYTSFFTGPYLTPKYNSNGDAGRWWLRSASGTSNGYFRDASHSGIMSFYAEEKLGVVLGFCM